MVGGVGASARETDATALVHWTSQKISEKQAFAVPFRVMPTTLSG